ncbi:hypothetical protein BaRGS_00016690 [Batillaria attramentaria]|uniref:Uncharacterized protein n=1 Tax=Batillaria attramentaria TaxID=370345 RepID=A0ABD0KXL4_9CAEN
MARWEIGAILGMPAGIPFRGTLSLAFSQPAGPRQVCVVGDLLVASGFHGFVSADRTVCVVRDSLPEISLHVLLNFFSNLFVPFICICWFDFWSSWVCFCGQECMCCP